MLKQWLKAGFMEKGELYPTIKGTPQGGIISPLLMNMTLDGLEAAVRKVRSMVCTGNKDAQRRLLSYGMLTTSSSPERHAKSLKKRYFRQ